MWWISVAAGAAAGAFSVVLASFIFGSGPKGMKSAGTSQRVTYWLVFALAWGLTKEFIVPPLQLAYAAHSLDDVLVTHPAFATLKKYEPQTYNQMLTQGKKDLQAGTEVSVVQSNIRAYLSPLVEKRIPVADDRAVAEYMKVMMAEMRELYSAGDAACYTFMFPNVGPPFNIMTRIQAATREADGATLARVIETAATVPQTKPSLEEVQPQLTPVVIDVQSKHGQDAFDLLSAPQATTIEQRKVCAVIMDLYGGILKSEPVPAGRMLRAVFGSGG